MQAPAAPAAEIAPAAPAPPAVDYSLRRYLAEAVEVLTNADSRVVASFRALLFRPGELTRAYFSADRERYLRPLQVFVFCNVFYFFVQPLTGINTLTSPLSVHMHQLGYSRWVHGVVEAEVARRGIGLDEYRALFDATIQSQAKTLVIVMVPLLALLLLVAHARQRRFFVEHLVFATHFMAFFILTIPLLWLVIPPLARLGLSAGIGPAVLNPLLDAWFFVGWCGLYIYGGLRRAYGDGRLRAVLRAAALGWGVMLVITAYRAALFFTAFYAV
jgi:hypothetical protein